MNAQVGFQLGVNGQLSMSAILNQNNYGDPTGFEPSYRFTKGYGAQLKMGYNFLPYIGLFLSGGRSWGGQHYADKNKMGAHEKQIDLSYYYSELLVRYNPILERNQYKTKQKIRAEINLGIRVSRISTANVEYLLNDKKMGYPFHVLEYDYKPIKKDLNLFKTYDFGVVAKVGFNWYVTERFYFDPGVKFYLGLNDINNKKYTVHPNYNSSRNFFAGINLGLNYYITYKSIK